MSAATDMMTPRTAVHTLTGAAQRVGVTLPAVLADEAARLDAATARLQDHRASRPALAAAVMAALEEERDPTQDEAVAREVTRHNIYALGISGALEDHKSARLGAVLVEHTPAILATFAPVVVAANKILTRARKTLPGVDLADTAQAAHLRPAELSLWGQAREAVDHVVGVAGAWSVLMTATGQARPGQALMPLIVAPLSGEQLQAIGGNVKRAHEPGEPLTLADVAEYRARVERVERDRARAAEAARAEAAYQLTGRRRAVVG